MAPTLCPRRSGRAAGGVSVPLCSLDWFRLIRPARGLLELAAGSRSRPWPRGLRPLTDAADLMGGNRLARRAITDDSGAVPVVAELDPQVTVDRLARAPGFDLTPLYDAASFAWLLERCRDKAIGGRLRAMAVSEPQGRDLGWFVYYEKRPRVGEVVQLVANDGQLEAVLDAAIADAAAQGLALLRGDVDARDLQAYRDALCLLNTGRWMLVHKPAPSDRRQLHVRQRAVQRPGWRALDQGVRASADLIGGTLLRGGGPSQAGFGRHARSRSAPCRRPWRNSRSPDRRARRRPQSAPR